MTECGITRARMRSALARGDWANPHRGVLVATAAPATWLQTCVIAALASRGVVSHRAAAQVHRLDGFTNTPVEVTVASGSHWPDGHWITHRALRLDPSDTTVVNGVPVTSIARTLVDLGAVVDDDLVEQALDDALRRGTSIRWIVGTLERVDRPGPSGCGALKRVLARPDRLGPLPDSTFERLLERACTKLGLPQPERQLRVTDAAGQEIARLDAAWPPIRLGVEAHSERWHAGPRRGRSDQQRDNRLAAAGWELLYAGWHDVKHADEFMRLLRDAYEWRSTGRGSAV